MRQISRSDQNSWQQFEAKFGLKAKGFTDKQIAFAQSVLSEMLGSVGYFTGNLSVIAPGMAAPVAYAVDHVIGVTSRSVFPHSFLWTTGSTI